MKKVAALILSFILIISLSSVAYADVIMETGDWSLAKTSSNMAWEIRSYNGTEANVTLLDKYGVLYITSLGAQTFANSEEIVSVTMNRHMQGIKEYAFLNSSVSSVTLNSDLIEIGRGAFSGTTQLTSLNLEDSGIQMIEEYTFLNSGLESITLPDTLLHIGQYAFMQCTGLSKVTIPASVEEIADNAFEGCDNLTIYCYTDSYAHEYAERNEIPYVLLDEVKENTYVVGDTDGDGKVTILDANRIQKILALLYYDSDGMCTLRGDSNEDGLDILDATRIQRYLVKYQVDAPIGAEAALPSSE